MERLGSLLENTVKRIFQTAGFKVKQNIRMKSYEIDVLAEHKGYTIAVECKERESGSLIVRNLIHEWSGKNKIINADKVLLAVYGVKIKPADKQLAKENNITIWNERDIERFLDMAIKRGSDSLTDILDSLDFEEGIHKRKMKTSRYVTGSVKDILSKRTQLVYDRNDAYRQHPMPKNYENFIKIETLDKKDLRIGLFVVVKSLERDIILPSKLPADTFEIIRGARTRIVGIVEKDVGTEIKIGTHEAPVFEVSEEVEIIPI